MITFSFLPVYFHFPQRVSSITICPAFLLIPFTFLPSLDHLTHYSLCQQVDYCLYCRAPFNRASGHCPQSWEWEADASAEESGRKDLSLGGMQMHSPPTDLHLTFIIPWLEKFPSWVFLAAKAPASHTDFFPKNTQPLTPWGRKMQQYHFQRAPQRLTAAGSNSSSPVHSSFQFFPHRAVLVYLVDIVRRTRCVSTLASLS